MKYKKAYQTFFCVFGVCYGPLVDERETPCTGQLTGLIKREGHSECQYVLTQTDTKVTNTYYQLDHKTGQVVVYAIRSGQRSYEPLIKLQSDEFKQSTKQEAQNQCEKLCAELLEREIQVGQLSKQDMADLACALIDARSPTKKDRPRLHGIFRRDPVKQLNTDLMQSPTLDLSMLKQLPVSESDLDSTIDSDKVSTASGSTPIISDDSDGSKTPSINGDLSDPAGSDVPEISSDVSDKHSECGSVETNSVIQEVNSEEEPRLNEVVNKVSVGVNTEQDVNPSENSAVNQVNYRGNQSEINPTKSNANFDSVDYKQFDPNEFIRFLLESIERSRLALKSVHRKLLGKIEL